MESFNVTLESKIQDRPASERVWVVRASGGRHVHHFKHANVVAIGHINELDLDVGERDIGNPLLLHVDDLAKRLISSSQSTKHRLSSHISQVRKFFHDISKGDLVVTLDSNSVAVGRIQSQPFIDKNPVDFSDESFRDKPMDFHLRRTVSWGPTFKRNDLPLPLERIFRSHQTVFEITKYWDYIYHLLYPAFTYKEALHLSLRVRQEGAIRSRNVADLLYALQNLEGIAAVLANEDFSESLTVQAGFFSKGDIWPKLSASEKKRVAYVLLIGLLLFGGEVGEIKTGPVKIGPFKFNGAIEAVANAIKAAEPVLRSQSGKGAVEGLKIEVPKPDTSGLESQPSDENPKRGYIGLTV